MNNVVIIGTRIGIVVVLLLLWEYAILLGHINPAFTSYPSEIIKDFVTFALSGELWKHASITLLEAFSGLAIGTFVGIALGVLLGQIPFLGKVFSPIVTALHGIPQLTLAPIYILWFGLGLSSKIFLASFMVFFVIFFATYGAMIHIDKRLVESAHLLGASKIKTVWYVVLPSSMPWIFTGIRSALGVSLIGAIVGEYMGASAGFGWMVAYATSYFNIKRVMSCILVLLLTGLFMNWCLDVLENSMLRWRTGSAQQKRRS